jgi:hypothetical protein
VHIRHRVSLYIPEEDASLSTHVSDDELEKQKKLDGAVRHLGEPLTCGIDDHLAPLAASVPP